VENLEFSWILRGKPEILLNTGRKPWNYPEYWEETLELSWVLRGNLGILLKTYGSFSFEKINTKYFFRTFIILHTLHILLKNLSNVDEEAAVWILVLQLKEIYFKFSILKRVFVFSCGPKFKLQTRENYLYKNKFEKIFFNQLWNIWEKYIF